VKARQVADYVSSNWQLSHVYSSLPLPVSENIAAILVDAVFQAGLNYRTVVFPRVCAVARAFPKMVSLEALDSALQTSAFDSALTWNHAEKPKRLRALVTFFRAQGLDTIDDIRCWLTATCNCEHLRSVRGIGHKTIDYLARLVGLAVIAVDRHAHRLLDRAGIISRNYAEAKRILEFAADLLQINRWAFDHLMWETLSANI
jgi:hypothetical protein